MQGASLQDMPEQEPNNFSSNNIGRSPTLASRPQLAFGGDSAHCTWHTMTFTPSDGQDFSHCTPCIYADHEHEDLTGEPAGDVATATTAAPRQERTSTDVHAGADPAAAQAPTAEDETPAATQDASDLVASAPPHRPPLQPEPANPPLSSRSPSAESDRCNWHALCTLASRGMCSITAVTALTHLSDCMRNHFHTCSSCHAT